jgi:CHAT domain-containing protein
MRLIRLLAAALLFFLAVPRCRSAESAKAIGLLKRAQYFADLYNWHVATPLFQEAEALLWNAGDRRNATYAHVGVLFRASTTPFPDRSRELARLLSTDHLFLDDKELRLFALVVKGRLDGEVDQSVARQDWTEVIKIAKEIGNTKWTYRAEGELGFADYYDGDLLSCQQKVASALIAAKQAGDVGAQVFFLSTTANGYLLQRLRQQEAIYYARKAIAIAAAYPDAGSPYIANYVLIQALANVGKLSEAGRLVENLLIDPNLDHVELTDYLWAAGGVAMAAKHYPESLKYFEHALSLAQARGVLVDVVELQSSLSSVYLSLGNMSKAEESARNTIATLERYGMVTWLPAKLDALAQVLIAEKKYSDADVAYKKALALQNTLVSRATSTIVKTALITGADQLYAHYFSLIVDNFNNPDEAYKVVEEARGRVVADLLLSQRSVSHQAVETEQTISRLRLQMKALRSSEEIKQQRDAIFFTEEKRKIDPDIALLTGERSEPIAVDTVQHSLDASEILLEYVLAEPHSYVLVLTSNSRQIINLPGRNTIEQMVAKYTTAIKHRTRARTQARNLYNALLSSIPQIASKSRYIVIPDACLNVLPFDALVDEDDRYVVQSHVVTYVSSSTTLCLLRSKPLVDGKKANALLAVGGVPYTQRRISRKLIERGYRDNEAFGDLPNSEPEANVAVAAVTSPDSKKLNGRLATEANVKRALQEEYGYVHLAVHAFSSENPDRASLVLLDDPSSGEDGFLEASEVVEMWLPAKLIVLSACETNIGPIDGEEGISTLSTAFLLAGARTVISTLWSIEDQPSLILMTAFYRHLSSGRSPADAMAVAKRELLSKYSSKSLPIYWAGFVVQGSEPSLQNSRPDEKTQVSILEGNH